MEFFPIRVAEMPFSVNITVTCTKMREAVETTATLDGSSDKPSCSDREQQTSPIVANNPSSETEGESNKNARLLPVSKCLHALAEMRRANWFSSSVPQIPSCIECIRVVKVLRHERNQIYTCRSKRRLYFVNKETISSSVGYLSTRSSVDLFD